MGLVLAIVFIVCSILSYIINRNKITHTTVFSLLWGVILLLESMHLFGLYESDVITYLVILVGVISFLIGSLFVSKINVKCINTINKSITSIDKRRFLLLAILSIVILIYPAVLNITALRSGQTDFISIRSSFANVYKNVVLQLIYNYIALPFSSSCIVISAVVIFGDVEKKFKIIVFVIVTIIIIEKVFVDAGRGIIIYFFAMLLISYKLDSNRKRISKKAKKVIFWVAIGVTVSYATLSFARGTAKDSLFDQVYVYLCGCVPFLNANIKEVNVSGEFLYGSGGFHGLLQFVFTMLENIGLCQYPEFMQLSDTMYTNTLQSRYIGATLSYNAYASAFYNVYIDGGIFAVGIEMFLYGSLARLIYNSYISNTKDQRKKAIYVFLLFGILFSFIRFQFALANNLIAYAQIFFIMRERVIENESSTDKYCLQ